MINKKMFLGKTPNELGEKDAVHVAIVSVRAGCHIEPGQRCGINEHGEAVSSNKGVGIADPFRKGSIEVGQSFWLMLNPNDVQNVTHTWDHPLGIDFNPPTREVQKNQYIDGHAKDLGVTYEQLMDACSYAVNEWKSASYPGNKNEEEFDDALDQLDTYDLWYEWANETGHEFENIGSACCPEYHYPTHDFSLFTWQE